MKTNCSEPFASSCRIYLDFFIFQYLLAHEEGRLDGAAKSMCHMQMVQFYLAIKKGIADPNTIPVNDPEYIALRAATRTLTDHLDTEIGFPLSGKPDYQKLVPLFFEKFHQIACASLFSDNESGKQEDSMEP